VIVTEYRLIAVLITLSLGCMAREIYSRGTSESDHKGEQLKIGNLALPISQQPSPLFSIGQNIIEKGDLLLQSSFGQLKGPHQNLFGIIEEPIYGVSDNFSILLGVPAAPLLKQDMFKSSGISDIFVQAEYAYYNKEHYTSNDQATVLAALLFPTGSIKKKPPTGLGTASVFLGGTASHISIDWYVFISSGALFTPPNHKLSFGSQFLYEAGLGVNLGNPRGWIALGLVEFNGIYSHPGVSKSASVPAATPAAHHTGTVAKGIPLPSGKGNIIFLGPSIYLSSERAIIQAGIQFPIVQQFASKRSKTDYRIGISLSWKF
jgi:hypothetical protein